MCLYLYWLGRLEAALAESHRMGDLAAEEGSMLWAAEASRMSAWIHIARGESDESSRRLESSIRAIDKSPSEFIPATTGYTPGSLDHVRLLRTGYSFSLGMAAVLQGNTDGARGSLAEMAELIPWHAALLEAEILLAEGHGERAIAVCQAAALPRVPYMSDTEGMMTYNMPPLRDVLARAYAQQGEIYRAIEEYEKLLAPCPTARDRQLIHPLYHFRLAELYRTKGWLQKARVEYERFLSIWGSADEGIEEVRTARARVAETGETGNIASN
jgi:tetratricopeptide (TPR) repeat protein